MNRNVRYPVDITLRFFLSLALSLAFSLCCFVFDYDDHRFVETRVRKTEMRGERRFSKSSLSEELFSTSRRTYRPSFLTSFTSINKEIDQLDCTVRSFVTASSKD
jgi:hypothetical protein